jgi:hypothetical protein
MAQEYSGISILGASIARTQNISAAATRREPRVNSSLTNRPLSLIVIALGVWSMSLVSSHVDFHLPQQKKKPKFALAEIMAGIVIAAVALGLGAVAAFSAPITLP